MKYMIVDLGTKFGGAIAAIRKNLANRTGFWHRFYQVSRPKCQQCLGVTNNKRHVAELQKKNYKALVLDLNKAFPDETAAIYSAWHFLEHVESVKRAQELIRQMLQHSTHGLWLRLPSFEFSAELEKHELRWYWANWTGHPSHLRLGHVKQVIAEFEQSLVYRIRAVRTVTSTAAPEIIPAREDLRNVGKYTTAMGVKPIMNFKNPLATAYDFHIRKKSLPSTTGKCCG